MRTILPTSTTGSKLPHPHLSEWPHVSGSTRSLTPRSPKREWMLCLFLPTPLGGEVMHPIQEKQWPGKMMALLHSYAYFSVVCHIIWDTIVGLLPRRNHCDTGSISYFNIYLESLQLTGDHKASKSSTHNGR